MKRKTTFLMIFIFILILAGASVLYGSLSKKLASERLAVQENTAPPEEVTLQQDSHPAAGDQQEAVRVPAPDFIVQDAEGAEVRLSDFFGKPIVLNFWASWCGPCKSEMPAFHEKYLELGEDVQFLLVNLTDGSRETLQSASEYIEEQDFTFPVFYDTSVSAAAAYSVYSIPSTYFIDAEGCAIAWASGPIDSETLQRGIDMITPE